MRRSAVAFILIVLLSVAVGFFSWYTSQINRMKQVFSYAAASEISVETLNVLSSEIAKLPQIWPISSVGKDIQSAQSILTQAQAIQTIEEPLNNINTVFDRLIIVNRDTKHLLRRLQSKLQIIPGFLISETQQQSLLKIKEKLYNIEQKTVFFSGFETTLNYLYNNESRVVLLLQNTNEPRSTGGFMGSFIQIDFKKNKTFEWQFKDIYSIDRNVPESAKNFAPTWFDGLANTISLRDANFHPDFATSAQEILRLMESANEPVPEIIGAINLGIVAEILKVTGPIELRKWNLEVNDQNFDLVLQFLVEGKVLGRFNVKDPVLQFVEQLFSKQTLSSVSFEALRSFDYENFLRRKNLQFYSDNNSFQTLFRQWNIAGTVAQKNHTDNFLMFDFVSVGANKSEKFLWTKIRHDAVIHPSGKVENVLAIKRNHTLKKGMIDNLLAVKNWSDNLKDLLQNDLIWKLGYGQNRTVVRVFIPKDAEFSFGDSPSGAVTVTEDEQFKILEVPLFVLPGEVAEAQIKYYTKIKRGSWNWRPYTLQLDGTPGREKTRFMTTIDTIKDGKFSAETFNIGRPVDLINQVFKAVIEF